MKFITESVSRCAARLGFLSEFERMPDLIFETPLVMVHTKVNFYLLYPAQYEINIIY